MFEPEKNSVHLSGIGRRNIETELNINVSYFIQDFQSSQLQNINIFRC